MSYANRTTGVTHANIASLDMWCDSHHSQHPTFPWYCEELLPLSLYHGLFHNRRVVDYAVVVKRAQIQAAILAVNQ